MPADRAAPYELAYEDSRQLKEGPPTPTGPGCSAGSPPWAPGQQYILWASVDHEMHGHVAVAIFLRVDWADWQNWLTDSLSVDDGSGLSRRTHTCRWPQHWYPWGQIARAEIIRPRSGTGVRFPSRLPQQLRRRVVFRKLRSEHVRLDDVRSSLLPSP
ncbi:hypothetical protein DHEL01_v200382 [Diaporthe helianthi]|uniref:Uncharacterized protein n=1 Tax=Diaporthe helianthi TaxID=158607 RepID=A0A2P5IFE5_DIAHE|nr:hypothetical protein DHEL01_v200382 [Diaporthe helianthi]